MNERQEQILKKLIEVHVSTAEPVGSKVLVEEKGIDLSPATIRNEFVELEKAGFIVQPHTSAGRIPTAKGIEYYVQHLLQPSKIPQNELSRLEVMLRQGDLRYMARHAAQYVHAACMLSQGTNDVYITGISNLFPEPERNNAFIVESISRAVDQIEVCIPMLYEQVVSDVPVVFVGSSNPLGRDCSLSCSRVMWRNKDTIIGLITPLRTNYSRTMGYLTSLLSLMS